MADAAAARREARRKRILENSQNRLQLISGKSSDECLKESPNRFPIPEQNCEVSVSSGSSNTYPPPLNNGLIIAESESFGLLPPSNDFVAAGDRELANDLAAFVSPTPAAEPAQKTYWEKLIAYKYDIVLLSLLIQLLYSLSLFTFDNGYFFLPLVMSVVTKLMWVPTHIKPNIANAFLLLNGMSANRVQSIMNVIQWMGIISQDVCVYLFTTICIQYIGITLVNNLIT